MAAADSRLQQHHHVVVVSHGNKKNHHHHHHLYESIITSKNNNNNFTAYRPRLLYSALFSWNTVTCGKFIAPFLEDLSPELFTDGVVGMTLAVQYAIVAIFAGWGGRLADVEERKCLQKYIESSQQQQHSSSDIHQNSNNFDNGVGSCWGVGRLKVLSFSILLGTCAILGHAVPSLYTQYYTTTTTNNQQQVVAQFPYELAWQVSMRCIYALSLAIMAPCMDGLALAHLDCIEGASQADFGKERMYGAAFWGLGSLCAGIGIDHYGFGFLYVMSVMTALLSYVAIGAYLIGLRRDTTGVFVTVTTTTSADATAATTTAAPSSSSSSSLLAVVGEEEWNGTTCMDADDEQTRRQTQTSRLSSRNTSSNEQVEDESNNNNNNKTSFVQLFSLFCKTGYGKALLFFVFSLAVGISIVDNLAFIFFDSLGSSNTMNGLTVLFTVVSIHISSISLLWDVIFI
jgi:hypothetical protein